MNRFEQSLQFLGALAISLMLGMASVHAQYDYTYDALGRLIKVEETATSKELCYGYDRVGNRNVVAGAANNCNLPPVANNDSLTTTEDTSKEIDPRGNDTDDHNVSLVVASPTDGAKGTVAVTANGTKLTYTPNANMNGSDSFTYVVSDGFSASNTATVNVTINAVNDPPDAVSDLYLDVDNTVWTTLPVRLNDSDVDSGTLTITALSGVVGQAEIISGGTFVRYKSSSGGEGSFTYTLSDGSLTDTAYVTVIFDGGGLPLF